MLDVLRQLADGGAGAIDHLGAGGRLVVGAAGRFRGALGVVRHVLHTDRHLVDRGGDLIGFALLARRALGAAVHRAEQFTGVLAELARGVADAADHGAGFGFQHLHGEGDLAVLVTPAGVDQLPHRIVADPARLFGESLQGRQRR